ncbi:MAG: 2Fe-2S iron-sulfur cluster-binding protein [Saprospiraceae bacterium]
MFVFMSNASFYPLTVSEIRRLNKESVSITFSIPDNLKSTFQFISGQYLTIRSKTVGEEIRRSYSICSFENGDTCTIGIKKVKDGVFSSYANSVLKKGDILEVMPPQGSFTIASSEHNHVVFFAAGSGITPILSHIKSLLFNFSHTKVTLFFGNRNFESIMFREELEGLKNKFIDRFALYHVFSKEKIGLPIFHGRIDINKTKELVQTFLENDEISHFLICGPNEMVFSVRDGLLSKNISENKIKFELFNVSNLKSIANPDESLPHTPEIISNISIQMDGDIFEFELSSAGQNLLDAALENGADLPFSCKGGVCSTCKAKVLKGNVRMDINYALEPDEVENGYILMCQSHPLSEDIYIDFDQK